MYTSLHDWRFFCSSKLGCKTHIVQGTFVYTKVGHHSCDSNLVVVCASSTRRNIVSFDLLLLPTNLKLLCGIISLQKDRCLL